MPEKLTPHRKAEDFHFPPLPPLPSKVPFHSLWTLQMFYVRSINLGGRKKGDIKDTQICRASNGSSSSLWEFMWHIPRPHLPPPHPHSSLQESKLLRVDTKATHSYSPPGEGMGFSQGVIPTILLLM